MQVELSIVVGVLFAAGVYMVLRRSLVKLIIGIGLLSHGANLLIFTAGGLTRGYPPLIGDDGELPAQFADPLPQALILTAIVISFGVTAFTVVLFQRAYRVLGTDDTDALRATDRSE